MHPAEVCETLRDAEAVAILSESIGGLLQADGSFSLGKILDDNTVKLTLVCLSVCVFYQNLLNNTTLCANWSLPWGVLRS